MVVRLGNALQGSGQLDLALLGSVLPPLRNNLPPLELRDNQPLVGDRPPLEVVLPPLESHNNQPLVGDQPPLEAILPPLEGGLSVVLPVLLVLCCVVPLLLRSRFSPSQLVKRSLTFFNASSVSLPAGILPWSAVASCCAPATTWDLGETVGLVIYWCL